MPGEVELATAALGLVEAGVGLIGKGKRTREINALIAKREAFKTPDEILKIKEATEFNAARGLGSETLDYLTNQNERAFSSAVGSANLLGGDPNASAAIFDQNFQGLMKIGSANHAANLANFTQYLGALNTVAENKAAEQVSKDNLLKDQIQAKTAAAADKNKMVSNGLNTAIAGAGAYAAGQLGKDGALGDTTVFPLKKNNTPAQLIPTPTPVFNLGITTR